MDPDNPVGEWQAEWKRLAGAEADGTVAEWRQSLESARAARMLTAEEAAEFLEYERLLKEVAELTDRMAAAEQEKAGL